MTMRRSHEGPLVEPGRREIRLDARPSATKGRTERYTLDSSDEATYDLNMSAAYCFCRSNHHCHLHHRWLGALLLG